MAVTVGPAAVRTTADGIPLAVPGRIPLAVLPTPLVPAPRLAAALGVGSLYVKRDDLTGFAAAGNKARPLEFLLAAAACDEADTLLTGGAPGSNFCAAAAAAAHHRGLACHLVLAGDPVPPGPALALALGWGATVSWTHSADRASVDRVLPRAAHELIGSGSLPYLIPRGGATGLGAVGHALAAFELREQLTRCGAGRARVTVAVGSGATLAGLVAGNVLLGRPWTLLGASVSRPPEEAASRVLGLARECVGILACDLAGEVTAADVTVVDACGPGHGQPSPEGTAAGEQAMRTEALMLDPVYTAKALALIMKGPGPAGPGAGRRGEERPRMERPGAEPPGGDEPGCVVFWHTGGLLDAVAAAAGDQS
jgi:1-aminocyclopropane-1-carboxylate deaminase/D-cysteine desulfhydrase-like pyridoxal-dependent ACC family enzyme